MFVFCFTCCIKLQIAFGHSDLSFNDWDDIGIEEYSLWLWESYDDLLF